MERVYSSVLRYVGFLYFVPRGCGTAVCGDGFCPLSLYGPAALLAVCRPDVESRPSLLQDPWSLFRRTPIPSGLGREASGPHRMRDVDGGSVPRTEASFHGGYGGTGYPLPSCTAVRGGSAHLVGFSVWFQPLASSFRVPQPIGQSIVPSLYTGEARGVPVSNNDGGDGVSEWRGATSFTDSLLHDTGV